MLMRPDHKVLSQISVWSPAKHCLELDGVRGLAILMVTVYRILKELPTNGNGWLEWIRMASGIGEKGVDLFFVLSGFLITGILIETRGKSHYFRNFIARRALRIFPLYFVALALFLWLIPAILGVSSFQQAQANQWYLWTYSSNVYMSWTNSWCFGPLDHFWSLAVEEHFYFVWPAVVFFLPMKWLWRVCVLGIFVSSALRIVASTRSEFDVAVNVLTLFRCDSLLFGSLLASVLHMWAQGDRKLESAFSSPGFRKKIIVALGAMTVISIGLSITGKRWFTIPSTLFPLVWMLVMWLLLTSDRWSLFAKAMRFKVLRWFGKYSYGMYVFQLPLLTLLPFSLLGLQDSWLGPPAFLIYFVSSFGLIAFTAWCSFQYMESRFLHYKKWFV